MAGEFHRNLDPVILTGSVHPTLATSVGKILNYDVFPANRKSFADTELNIKLPVNVAGRHVYVIQPTCRTFGPDGNTVIPGSANTSVIETALIIDAANQSDAGEITVIMPHFAGQRADKKDEPRVPLSGKLLAELYQNAGADRIITMDLHNPALENAIRGRNTWKNVFASWVLVPEIEALGLKRIRVTSPDSGGLKRGEKFYEMLHGRVDVLTGVYSAAKHRPNNVKDMSTTDQFELDLKGENAVEVDDVLSSGKTLADGAAVFKEAGAARVIAVVTHGIWTNDAVSRIRDSAIEQLFVTDSVPQPKSVLEDNSGRIKVFSVAPIIAGIIECLETGDSISSRYILTPKEEEPVEPLYQRDPNRPTLIGSNRPLGLLQAQLLSAH